MVIMKMIFIAILLPLCSFFLFINATTSSFDVFDPKIYNDQAYLTFNADLRDKNFNSAQLRSHWANYGLKEGRRASFLYHSQQYLQHFPVISQKYGNNYESITGEYLSVGVLLGRPGVLALNPLVFNLPFYKGRYSDMNTKPDDEIRMHWLISGINEGRKGSAFFLASEYSATNSDLKSAFGSNWLRYIEHFVLNGEAEGRSGLTKFGSQNDWNNLIKRQRISRALEVDTSKGDIVKNEIGADGEPIQIIVKFPRSKACTSIEIKKIGEGLDATPIFKKAFEAAKICKGSRINVEKGKYYFRSTYAPGFETHLFFNDLEDVIFDGGASEFIFTKKASAINLNNLKRVVISNFSIRYEGFPLVSKGSVIQHGSGKALKIEDDYSIEEKKDIPVTSISEYDFLKNNWVKTSSKVNPEEVYFDSYNSSQQPVYDEINDVYTHPAINGLSLNKEFLIRHRTYNWSAVRTMNVSSSEDLHLVKIIVYSSPGMAFAITDIRRGLRIEECKTQRYEGDYISSSSDALHLGNNGGDVIIKNNHFQYQGDDAINTGGRSTFVMAISDDKTQIEVANHNIIYNANDEISFFNINEAYLGTAKIKEFKKLSSGNIWLNFGTALPYLSLNQIVRNSSRMGSPYLIEWNRMSYNRARAMIIQSPNGIIRNNTISSTSHNAIIIGSTSGANTWNEGFSTSNIVLSKNSIHSPGYANKSAISIQTLMANNTRSPLKSNTLMLIEGNAIYGAPAACFVVSGITNLTMRSNTCTQQAPSAQFQYGQNLLYSTPKAYFLEGRGLVEDGNDFLVIKDNRTTR